jgi:hypothetical protein
MLDNQTQQAQYCAQGREAAMLPISQSTDQRTDALSKCGLSHAKCLARLADEHLFRGRHTANVRLGFLKRLAQILQRLAGIGLITGPVPLI